MKFWPHFVLSFGILVPVLADTVVSQGLVAHYKFEMNLRDSSQGMQDGVKVGNPQFGIDRFGVPSRAVYFATLADAVSLEELPVSLEVGSTNSVCFWMNWTGQIDPSDPAAIPFSWGKTELNRPFGGNYLLMFQNQASQVFGFGPGNGEVWGTKYNAQFLNQWVHVVAQFVNGDFTKSQLFINGEKIESKLTFAGNPEASPEWRAAVVPSAQISGTGENNRNRFIGGIDEVRIYNRALGDEEVQAIFVSEAPPTVSLVKAVKPSFSRLQIGQKYQLQTSNDLATWSNVGDAFTATTTSMIYPNYWDVENWHSIYFRIQIVE